MIDETVPFKDQLAAYARANPNKVAQTVSEALDAAGVRSLIVVAGDIIGPTPMVYSTITREDAGGAAVSQALAPILNLFGLSDRTQRSIIDLAVDHIALESKKKRGGTKP